MTCKSFSYLLKKTIEKGNDIFLISENRSKINFALRIVINYYCNFYLEQLLNTFFKLFIFQNCAQFLSARFKLDIRDTNTS